MSFHTKGDCKMRIFKKMLQRLLRLISAFINVRIPLALNALNLTPSCKLESAQSHKLL